MSHTNRYRKIEHSEFDNTNKRGVALLRHNWIPEETKFGEKFRGKNKIIIA